MAQFEVYKDKVNQFRWRLLATNKEQLAMSEEGFASKQSCQVSIESVRKAAAEADVVDA